MTDTTTDSLPHKTQRPFTDRHTWERLVYTLLFAIAFNVAEVVLWAIAVVQFLFKLFSGAPNSQLCGFGQSLGTYIYEIILFLTFRSENKPFPFASWPSGAPDGATKPHRRVRKKAGDA
ncbi:MAG: DUF4389 domain-containing protein [Proteobacteria bacterium]|nr:DUF4389 domain-containing protein [Pseudomonadota bacterium]